MRFFLALALIFLLCGALIAQPGPSTLTTTFASNNGQAGNMFDLDSFFPLDILGFDINVDPGVHDVEVWARTAPGSFSGSVQVPGDWTLIGSYAGVVSAGEDQPTPLPPFASPVRVAPGSVQAFYVTVVNSTALNYTNGSNPGGLFATDGVLNFYEGVGVIYPFGSVFDPRIWNGNIHYQVVGPPQPEYQVNQPGAALEIMGVQGDELNLAASAAPFCETVMVSWSGSASALTYDIAVTEGGAVVPRSAGAFATSANDQLVNIDLDDPTLQWLFDAEFSEPFAPRTSPALFDLGTPPLQVQMIVIDPTSGSGGYHSQPCEHVVGAAGSLPPLPPSDDGGATADLSQVACSPIATIQWYGVGDPVLSAAANGRLLKSPFVDTDFSATVAEARNDPPFIGYWTDLSPNAGGSWSWGFTAGGDLELVFSGVGYFGQVPPASSNSFVIRYVGATAEFEIDGLQGITAPLSQNAPPSFLGMSPGFLAAPATNPGPAAFAPAATGAAGAASDMLFEFTSGAPRPAAVAAGVNTLIFTPDGMGNYTWMAL